MPLETTTVFLLFLLDIPVFSHIAFFVKSFPFMVSRSTVPVSLSFSPEISMIYIGIILPLKVSFPLLGVSIPLTLVLWKKKF